MILEAFLISFGAVFVVLKQGRLLQLQYWTGKQGTAQDVAALQSLTLSLPWLQPPPAASG